MKKLGIMKKFFQIICILGVIGGFSSCSDLLDVDSSRQNFNPSIDSKTDSVFYAYGIFEAMQQLADQYVFQGEMRGDLVKTTVYTNNNLRQLANFSATTANKYDSAYVYYRVINNCNYYLKNRKKDLYTGSTNVVMPEYAGVAALRAWAYLQLGRNYQRVPFFTEPLTEISQIDNNDFPELTLAEIVDRLAPDLSQYSGYQLPYYGQGETGTFDVGSPNWESQAKRIAPHYCFVPVDVVLGDLYLETGQYDAAAKSYVTYLTRVAPKRNNSYYLAPMRSKSQGGSRFGGISNDGLPDNSQIKATIPATQWSTLFERNTLNDLITYIPMAVNSQQGVTTNVPLTFGFNYYATSEEKENVGNLSDPYVEKIQLLPSDVLNNLSDSTEYYYYSVGSTSPSTLFDSIASCKGGDMRLRSVMVQTTVDDSTMQWIDKYKYANIILYRTSTVLLHLAEAFNRLGMPDAAFAILKDGISNFLTDPTNGAKYMTAETKVKLQTTYPLLSDVYIGLFPDDEALGIHCHGAGKAASDLSTSIMTPTGRSPYQLDRMAGLKMDELAKNTTLGLSGLAAAARATTATKQDTINAVEDLLCDEYALEFAFEGCRYFDLMRLARHKNGHQFGSDYNGSPASYGANFGSRWLADKLAGNQPVVDLTDEKNWYLPFK